MPALARVLAAGLAATTIAVGLSACVPEPAPSAAPTVESSAAPEPTVPPTPTPLPSSTESPRTALPSSCEDIYSDAMLATLQADTPPLNDPSVTLLSTEQAPLLELLNSLPTLRCSWGPPGERGLATTVAIVGSEQADYVRSTLSASGFACEDTGTATLCRIEQRGVSLDDIPFERGEVQALRGEVWVTTSWINVDLTGYTEDILSSLAE